MSVACPTYNQLGKRESTTYNNIYNEITLPENDESDNDDVALGLHDNRASASQTDDTVVYLHPVHSDVVLSPREEADSDSEYDDAIIYLYPDLDDY